MGIGWDLISGLLVTMIQPLTCVCTKLGQPPIQIHLPSISHRPLATRTTFRASSMMTDTLRPKRTRLTAFQPLTDSTTIFLWFPLTPMTKAKSHLFNDNGH